MNVFVIPSWYPSQSNPIFGTFVYEQVRILAGNTPSANFGVSIWGQGDDRLLLWSKKPFSSIGKLFGKPFPFQEDIESNLTEYFDPAYTWTRKWRNGNVEGIYQANRRNLNRFVEQYGQVSVIHAQASYPGAAVAHRLSMELAIPFVVTIRMSPFPFAEFQHREGLDPLIGNPLQAADKLIATSRSLRDRLMTFDLNQVEVVNNPVDTDLFSPKEKTTETHTQFLAVGRLEHQKGFDILIQSMKSIDGNWHLSIVGEGAERIHLEELISGHGLSDKITLLGQKNRKETARLMQKADLFILSSRHETFGNVVLEALSCGVPVVATDCGGPRDIVTDQTGILVEPESEGALAGGISEALSRSWEGERLREHVMNKFSPESFSERMMQLYSDAVKS